MLSFLAVLTILTIVFAEEEFESFSERSQRKGYNAKIKKHSEEKKKRDALNPTPQYVRRKDTPKPTSSACVSTLAPHPTKP